MVGGFEGLPGGLGADVVVDLETTEGWSDRYVVYMQLLMGVRICERARERGRASERSRAYAVDDRLVQYVQKSERERENERSACVVCSSSVCSLYL